MRFLCCFKYKDKEGNLVLKSEMHKTKTDDISRGQLQLLVKLSTDYDIPAEFVDRNDDAPGILYINPKKEYAPDKLCEELDFDLEIYERDYT